MAISLIWAMAENGVIGHGPKIPWHLPDDFAWFKNWTKGHAIVMGRKTWDSIGRPLPKRLNVVVTRDQAFSTEHEAVAVMHDLNEAIECAAARHDEVFIAGGGELYRLAMPQAERLIVTVVHAEVEGDIYAPEVDWSQWRLVREEKHEADERHAHAFTFRVYEKAQVPKSQEARV